MLLTDVTPIIEFKNRIIKKEREECCLFPVGPAKALRLMSHWLWLD